MEDVIKIIELSISSFGINPDEVKVPDQNKWKLIRGSAVINVRIFEHEGEHGIEACAFMMRLPDDPETLYRLYNRVLVLNDSIIGAWFSIREDYLYLLFNRHIAGMTQVEVKRIIENVSYYADHYEHLLRDEFGLTEAP